MIEIPKGKLQLVFWHDACGPDNYQDQTMANVAQARPLLMAEVGFVVQESKDCITLAPEISDQGIMRRTITIPRVCIVRRIQLAPHRNRKSCKACGAR